MPLKIIALSTLPGHILTQETAIRSLMRNLGGSIGISVLIATLAQNTQVVHSRLVEDLRPDNPACAGARSGAPFSLSTPSGMATLNAEVTRQAAMVAHVNDFQLIMLIALASIPSLLLLRAPPATAGRGYRSRGGRRLAASAVSIRRSAPNSAARPGALFEDNNSPRAGLGCYRLKESTRREKLAPHPGSFRRPPLTLMCPSHWPTWPVFFRRLFPKQRRAPSQKGYIFAENVSSVGFVGLLIEQYGQDGEIAGPESPKVISLPLACAAAVALGNVLLGCLGLALCDGAARLNHNRRERHD